MWMTLVIAGICGIGTLLYFALRYSASESAPQSPRAIKTLARRLSNEPDFGRSTSETLAKRSETLRTAETAPPPSASELPELMNQLLVNDELLNKVAMIRLAKAGGSAEELLLATLEDPRCTWDRKGLSDLTNTPWERVARQLLGIPSRRLGERVETLVDNPAWQIHSIAVQARVSLGRKELVPWVLSQLAAGDVRQDYAEKGVDMAMAEGWAEPEFVQRVLEWSKAATLDKSRKFSAWAVGFYARNGGAEAIGTLQSPEVLSLENNRTIHFVLDQLNENRVRVPEATLRPLIEKSLRSETWPWPHVFRPALDALAISDREAALALAESQLSRTDGPYAFGAITFIRKSNGLPRGWELIPPKGMALSEGEMKILEDLAICSDVFGEVGNGGLSQYFFNSTGDNWPTAVQSLERIGHSEGSRALSEAAHLVHPDGASTDRNVRIKQYANLSAKNEKRFDELDPVFWSKTTDRVELRYMLKHKELFARLKAARLAAGIDKVEKE